jgi:hypothetical protein
LPDHRVGGRVGQLRYVADCDRTPGETRRSQNYLMDGSGGKSLGMKALYPAGWVTYAPALLVGMATVILLPHHNRGRELHAIL